MNRSPSKGDSSVIAALDPGDAAIFETFVNPRYLRHFSDLCLELLSPPVKPGDAVVAHYSCRTGYPSRKLIEVLGPLRLVGTDPSLAGLELARAKASATPGLSADYRLFRGFPAPMPDGSFSYALIVHPPGGASTRLRFIQDASRVLVPGGELVMALPIQGSFIEVADLIREFAVKHDIPKLVEQIDTSVALRPSLDMLINEFMQLGYVDVDGDTRATTIPFHGGRDFIEDPTTRLLLWPELRQFLEQSDDTLRASFNYTREAIDKYWSEGGFEITVNVGCVRGYRG